MARKYDIFKKSDMRKFQKDLEKTMKSMAKESLKTTKFKFNCPNCNSVIKVSAGKQICPNCSKEIYIKFDLQGL